MSELNQISRAIHISVLNQFEFENALRLAAFRKLLPTGSVLSILADFEADFGSGKLILAPVNLASAIAEARRLSARYTLRLGHRAFDNYTLAPPLAFGPRRSCLLTNANENWPVPKDYW